MIDYKCNKCGFKDEYGNSISLPKDMQVPKDMKCPKCKKGKLEQLFTSSGKIGIDVIGGYEYTHGRKARHLKSPAENAAILTGNKNPY